MEINKVKHKYQIDVVDCAKSVLTLIAADPLISAEIYDKHKEILRISVHEYFKSLDLKKNISEQEKFNESLLKVDHPSFDYWFAMFISTREIPKIPLILDDYYFGEFGEMDNFIGRLEFIILDIIDSQIPYSKSEIVDSIVEWIREVKISIYNEQDLGEDDIDLINTGLDFEVVFDYFKALHYKLNKKDRLTIKEVKNLIYSNFYFEKSDRLIKSNRKFYDLKIKKYHLSSFIYNFYMYVDKNNYKNKKEKYCKFLMNNFIIFKDNNLSTLMTNLNKPLKELNPLMRK
jgi:hypothetical protein